MNVVVPDILDTGVVVAEVEGALHVRLDVTGEVEILKRGEVCELSWKQSRPDGAYLFKAKAWCWRFMGRRKILVQVHRIQDNGSIGPRRVILERSNGRLVR